MGNIKCSPKEERATSSNRGTCCRPCRELARQVRVKWRTTPEDHTVKCRCRESPRCNPRRKPRNPLGGRVAHSSRKKHTKLHGHRSDTGRDN
ncbi:hypothetical protein FOBRF1_008138 [Fusarium oxysporum]